MSIINQLKITIMSTMINNLKPPYYYCLESFYVGGIRFCIGWEYQKDYIDKFRDINKHKFKLVE